MDPVSVLPHLNAFLNAVAAALLAAGFGFIRAGRRSAHKRCMIGAATVSILFLIGYITLRFYASITVFPGSGGVKVFYYALLISHVVLAVGIAPFVLVTLIRALARRFAAHKRLARWTLPVWLYVSLSGIAVYVMLYHLYPAVAAQ